MNCINFYSHREIFFSMFTFARTRLCLQTQLRYLHTRHFFLFFNFTIFIFPHAQCDPLCYNLSTLSSCFISVHLNFKSTQIVTLNILFTYIVDTKGRYNDERRLDERTKSTRRHELSEATKLPCSRLYAYMSTNLKSLSSPSRQGGVPAPPPPRPGIFSYRVNSLCVEVDYLEFLSRIAMREIMLPLLLSLYLMMSL